MPPLARTPPAPGAGWTWRSGRDGARVPVGLHRAPLGATSSTCTTCLVLHPALFALCRPLRRVLRRLDGAAPRGLGRRQPARQRPRPAAAHRRRRSPPRDRTRAHRLGRSARRCRGSLGAARRRHARSRPPAAPAGDRASPAADAAPPPGAFLQASRRGRGARSSPPCSPALPARLPARARIVELFAGCGTLTFALAARARVVAYEGDGRRSPRCAAPATRRVGGAARPRPPAAAGRELRARPPGAGPALCRRARRCRRWPPAARRWSMSAATPAR